CQARRQTTGRRSPPDPHWARGPATRLFFFARCLCLAAPPSRPPGAAGAPRLIRPGREYGRPVAFFTSDVVIPLRPFMGTMAVAPPRASIGQPGITVEGVQNSRPPGAYGGNLDFKDLSAGSSLFLPVFHAGARFYVGDPH